MIPLCLEWQKKKRFPHDKYLGTGLTTRNRFCPSRAEQIKPETIFFKLSPKSKQRLGQSSTSQHQGHSLGLGEEQQHKKARKPKTAQPVVSLETRQVVKVGSHISNWKSQGPNHKAEVMRMRQLVSDPHAGNGSQAEVPSHRTQRAVAETTEFLCFLPFKKGNRR